MIGDIAIATEVFQIVFVTLMAIIVYVRQPKAIPRFQRTR